MDGMRQTTILVTGGTGYIGSCFIRQLSEIYNLIALVRVDSDISGLAGYKCSIVRCTDNSELKSLLKEHEIDGVVHFASKVVVEHRTSDIDDILNSNIAFGIHLLDVCRDLGIKWFINTGTFWQNYKDEAYNPVNLYAATKEAFQVLAKYYTETSNLVFTTIKLNDTFGPDDPRQKIFHLWDKISQTGQSLDMSAGEQLIDISYIDDVISAYHQLIELLNTDQSGQYQNREFVITAPERMTLKELAVLYEEISGRILNINWGARGYRSREVFIPWSKGEPVPGWSPKHSLKQAIQQIIYEDRS